jgi:hypothetical protein
VSSSLRDREFYKPPLEELTVEIWMMVAIS